MIVWYKRYGIPQAINVPDDSTRVELITEWTTDGCKSVDVPIKTLLASDRTLHYADDGSLSAGDLKIILDELQ